MSVTSPADVTSVEINADGVRDAVKARLDTYQMANVFFKDPNRLELQIDIFI